MQPVLAAITAAPPAEQWGRQILWLFVLAVPIACIARTIVFEEVFREPREFCVRKSKTCATLVARKFFYLFTCEYCFSHWITLAFVAATGYKLLLDDWRGYVISFFALVLVANTYLNLYARLRVDLTSEKVKIEKDRHEVARLKAENEESGVHGSVDENSS
jgi:hypothetical protein